MLKKFAALGLLNLKVVDLRSSGKGSVKHLVELDLDQVKQVSSKLGGLERKEKADRPRETGNVV